MNQKEVTYLIAQLRRASLASAPRNECLRLARKKVFVRYSKAGKKIWKYHWQCAVCKEWYRDSTALEVDHIQEVGPFKGDWHDFIMRMFFCGQGNLRALCTVCHQKKTSNYNARLKYTRKKK